MSLDTLPTELRRHIFEYVFQPWHLEYTQVHDNFPNHGSQDIKVIASKVAASLTQSQPHFVRLPSIAPLLVCKAFHDAGREIFNASFTGHMHVISRMFWKEVHWSYAYIMAKTTTLIMDLKYLKGLKACRILDRMTNLRKGVFIVMDHFLSFDPTDVRYFPTRHDENDVGTPISSKETIFEGAHLKDLLGECSNVSDYHLQKAWNNAIRRPVGQWARTFKDELDALLNDTIFAYLPTTLRAVVLPSRFGALDSHRPLLLIMDFQCSGSEIPGQYRPDKDLILVRKKLVEIDRTSLL